MVTREELNKDLEKDLEKIKLNSKRKKIIKIVLIILGIIILLTTLFISYMKYVGTKHIRINEYNIVNKKIPKNFHGFKIVHFTDLNYPSTLNKKELNNLSNRINELEPDIILFTGNLIKDNSKSKDIINFFNNLKPTIDIYSIKGNLDYNKEYDNIISKTKVKVLNNNYSLIYYKGNIPILINGIGSKIKKDNDYNKAFSFNLIDNVFTISLIHEPKNIDNIIGKYDTDLILGGHSLNGLIRLPFIGGLVKFEEVGKYNDNYYLEKNTPIYISNGIGTYKYNYRLFNHPSINLYRLISPSK